MPIQEKYSISIEINGFNFPQVPSTKFIFFLSNVMLNKLRIIDTVFFHGLNNVNQWDDALFSRFLNIGAHASFRELVKLWQVSMHEELS